MFHHTYERLAPSVGYDTRVETRIFDPESPNGKLMLAVCADLLPKLRAQPQQERTERERFEAWAVAATPFGTQRNDEGFYQSSWMRNAWAAWQAALAQRTPTSSNAAAPTKQPKE